MHLCMLSHVVYCLWCPLFIHSMKLSNCARLSFCLVAQGWGQLFCWLYFFWWVGFQYGCLFIYIKFLILFISYNSKFSISFSPKSNPEEWRMKISPFPPPFLFHLPSSLTIKHFSFSFSILKKRECSINGYD